MTQPPMTALLYLVFFCSGVSGLIYQVVWVRVLGHAFGNTIYSASLVIAVFMVGLGIGGWAVGIWADRRYASRPESLLRTYGLFELLIALMALGVSIVLPHLGGVTALVSSYSRDANGWYALSAASYLARTGIAIVLFLPITLLMGGTLTLLIRHVVRRDPRTDGWRIAVLYGVNTVGAALGCVLTDFALVPLAGLRTAQWCAVSLNVIAGLIALLMTRAPSQADVTKRQRLGVKHGTKAPLPLPSAGPDVVLTTIALALIGFAAMGMEIVWFRHLNILLGGFRAVFSLLLTVILIGIGTGSLLCALINRYAAPARWLIGVQALFVVFTLAGVAVVDVSSLDRVLSASATPLAARSPFAATLAELWFNARPMLLEVAMPAVLMGFSFPLANAIAQRGEQVVGRRAGTLYLANTVGAVVGSVLTGFVLLPWLGIQDSVTLLSTAAAVSMVPLYAATRTTSPSPRITFASSLVVAGAAIGVWTLLPSDYIVLRALPAPSDNQRLLTVREALTEVISVTETPDVGRTLVTNGHPMSSTRKLSQRYMRALAHIPLLSMDRPDIVLVIGFGVGNTTHAATLHPSVRRVEVADLSRDIVHHASYFHAANHDVLSDARVVVYINDGRHHLQMQPPASYDLITLEPPPVGYAGVAALYSREFYELARTRLTSRGQISQWLPAYQVSPATTLSMVRAFVDVFPQAVLISGAESDLLLIGANDSRIDIDPGRVANALTSVSAVAADLRRLDLGSVREIVGTFVGSARRLAEATRDSSPVTDDRPLQEYSVLSLLNPAASVPASIVDLSDVADWCARCFVNGKPISLVDGLDTYLTLLDRAYQASPEEIANARRLSQREGRVIEDSAYLGAVVPESADVHDIIGVGRAADGSLTEAVAEFRHALRLQPDAARPEWHLGIALASLGMREDAIAHLRRSVQLDGSNARARYDLAIVLLQAQLLDEAVEHLRATLKLAPDFVGAYNNLGIALASQGKVDEAVGYFQKALALDPESAETRHNLSIVTRGRAGAPAR